MNDFFKAIARRKIISTDGGSKLKRVLGLWDLTFLGLGVTLGLGTYVLAGSVAKVHAGPAVCLSFLVAAIASALAGTLLSFVLGIISVVFLYNVLSGTTFYNV